MGGDHVAKRRLHGLSRRGRGDPIVLTKANAYRKVVEWDAETDTNRYGHETLVKMDRPEALRAIFACGFYETRIKESRERGIIKARELAA